MEFCRNIRRLFVAIALTATLHGALAQGLLIEAPEAGHYVLDLVQMIDADDAAAIQEISAGLFAEYGSPVVVVTIDSVNQYVGDNWGFGRFVRGLYDQWGMGRIAIEGKTWNGGILFVVSKNDREACIELGEPWRGDHIAQRNQVMREIIIPRFKEDAYSAGILAGVKGLEAMIKGELPPPQAKKDFLTSNLLLLVSVFVGVPVVGAFFFEWLKKKYYPGGYGKEAGSEDGFTRPEDSKKS